MYAVLLLYTIADLVCLRLLSDPVSGVLRLKCVEDSVALQLGGEGGPINKDNHSSFPCEWVLGQIILKAVHGDSLS